MQSSTRSLKLSGMRTDPHSMGITFYDLASPFIIIIIIVVVVVVIISVIFFCAYVTEYRGWYQGLFLYYLFFLFSFFEAEFLIEPRGY